MEKIDDIIKQSLTEDDAKFYNNLDEPTILESFNSLFKGKNKWITYYTMSIMILLVAFTVYSLIKLLNTEAVAEILKWGTGMFVSFISIGFLKIYYWMEMNKNIKLREMKKIEMQISLLLKKIENNNIQTDSNK